jgi:uncharacterized protein YjbI with pentapeptide repeats
MLQVSWECWPLSSSMTGIRSVVVVAAFLVFFFPRPYPAATEAASATTLVKPDQYNVNACEDYFSQLKPGLSSNPSYNLQEQYTIHNLCEARTADLSQLAEELAGRAVEIGAPPVDAISVKTLKAEFVKAIIKSIEFDAPGFDRIAISGAVIDGDLNLAKITINNALVLKDVQFLGNVDFSYSSTTHNLDISGTFPESKALCLNGFQTTGSVFIYNILYESDKQFGQKSFSFCADASSSIGLQGAHIGGHLSIRNTIAKTIDAEGAQIIGQVLIQNSTISEAVDFSGATAGGFSFLQVKSPKELNEDTHCRFSTVYLEGTKVQGSADFVRSDLCGISMTGAHVSRDVRLLGSRLAFFDFSGSNAEGDLQIGHHVGHRDDCRYGCLRSVIHY